MRSRPLSPHLQIYKPQLTSVMSILQRITGVGLIFGIYLFVFWLYSLGAGDAAVNYFSDLMEAWYGQLFALGIIFSACYHFFNGLRYLIWSVGFLLDIKHVYYSGYLILISTILLTIYLWW